MYKTNVIIRAMSSYVVNMPVHTFIFCGFISFYIVHLLVLKENTIAAASSDILEPWFPNYFAS